MSTSTTKSTARSNPTDPHKIRRCLNSCGGCPGVHRWDRSSQSFGISIIPIKPIAPQSRPLDIRGTIMRSRGKNSIDGPERQCCPWHCRSIEGPRDRSEASRRIISPPASQEESGARQVALQLTGGCPCATCLVLIIPFVHDQIQLDFRADLTPTNSYHRPARPKIFLKHGNARSSSRARSCPQIQFFRNSGGVPAVNVELSNLREVIQFGEVNCPPSLTGARGMPIMTSPG